MTDTATTHPGPCACGSTSWTVTLSQEGEDSGTLEYDPETGGFEMDAELYPYSTWSIEVNCDGCGQEMPEEFVDLVTDACPELLRM